DIDAREALVQALNAYDGAVVLISHDPHLIELTADRLWLVADGTCRPFDGDMDDYRRHLLEERRDRNAQRRAEKRAGETPSGGGAGGRSAVDRKEQRRAAAEARAAIQHLRRAAKEA